VAWRRTCRGSRVAKEKVTLTLHAGNLGAARRRSDVAVDAFVVAVADLAGGAVNATVDVVDMRALARHAKDVKVVSFQP
jgi:hypothetical protein